MTYLNFYQNRGDKVADVKWIQLSIDMFNNRKIKYLRSLPEGNNIILIWVALLTIAGRCNAGGMIFLTENVPYSPEMLASELDFEKNTVLLALEALKRLGMIQDYNDALLITGWEEHQNIDGLARIKEQNRIRKQRQREREAVKIECHVTGHANVTPCHATDKELDIDIDKEKNKDIVVANPVPESATFPPEGFEMMCVDKLIQSVVGQFKGAKVPGTVNAKIKWCEHIEKMKRLDHRTEAEIQEALDFAITDQFWKTNIRSTKTLREKFETLIMQARKPRGTGAVKSKPNQFQNFPQREIDYDALVLQQLQGG